MFLEFQNIQKTTLSLPIQTTSSFYVSYTSKHIIHILLITYSVLLCHTE